MSTILKLSTLGIWALSTNALFMLGINYGGSGGSAFDKLRRKDQVPNGARDQALTGLASIDLSSATVLEPCIFSAVTNAVRMIAYSARLVVLDPSVSAAEDVTKK